ncbi:hypothetical protein BC829DRAFT_435101 [Chytridium lagenaria]|nr:hypothetical protein BC829DRAFT_435101 [Chytridium lagenaria]
MTLQEAWLSIVGSRGCTFEVFQVYSYLKRLGFIVFRSNDDLSPKSNKNPASSKAIGTSFLGFRSFSLPQPFRSIISLASSAIRWIGDSIIRGLSCALRGFGFKGLQHEHSFNHPKSTLNPFFDVYKPNSRFRKSAKGQPDFKVVVVSSRDPVPDIDAIISLSLSIP